MCYSKGNIIEAYFDHEDRVLVGKISTIKPNYNTGRKGDFLIKIKESDVISDSKLVRFPSPITDEIIFSSNFITKIIDRGNERRKISFTRILPKNYLYKKGILRWYTLHELADVLVNCNIPDDEEMYIDKEKLWKFYKKDKFPGIIHMKKIDYMVKTKQFKKWVLRNKFKICKSLKELRVEWREDQKKFEKQYAKQYWDEIRNELDQGFEFCGSL